MASKTFLLYPTVFLSTTMHILMLNETAVGTQSVSKVAAVYNNFYAYT